MRRKPCRTPLYLERAVVLSLPTLANVGGLPYRLRGWEFADSARNGVPVSSDSAVLAGDAAYRLVWRNFCRRNRAPLRLMSDRYSQAARVLTHIVHANPPGSRIHASLASREFAVKPMATDVFLPTNRFVASGHRKTTQRTAREKRTDEDRASLWNEPLRAIEPNWTPPTTA